MIDFWGSSNNSPYPNLPFIIIIIISALSNPLLDIGLPQVFPLISILSSSVP